MISHIPISRAAFALAKDNKEAPVTAGATSNTIASALGTLLSTNHVATREEMMLTAPEGIFNNAASFELYPKLAMIVAEKLVTAPLCNTQAAQIIKITQIVESDLRVDVIWDIWKRFAVVTAYLFSTSSLRARKARSFGARNLAVEGLSGKARYVQIATRKLIIAVARNIPRQLPKEPRRTCWKPK